MTNPSVVYGAGKRDGITSTNIAALTPMAPRRTGYGSALRSQLPAAEQLRQPQDGAAPIRAKLATITAHLQSQNDFFQEPEDARLTGGTRSLKRRLLGLNMGLKLKKVPAIVAGAIAQPKVA